jgi:predicted porin
LNANILSQSSLADSSKGGQMFNQAAYFGVSSPIYGTFTMGRQSALSSDLLSNYDPLAGSNAWSLLTFQGANGGGGDTEDRVFDNSYEYRVSLGPVRVAVEAQLRNGGNSSTGNAFQGDIGFDYMGFSLDFLGGKIDDAVSAGILSQAQLAAASATATAVSAGNGLIAATVSDNTVFSVGARYVIGPWKFWGGYEHIDFANPNNPLNPGAFVTGGFIAGAVNNTNFTNDKILQTAWVGARYSFLPSLDITGAYYHEWQNSFGTGAVAGCTDARSSQCSGTLDAVSLVVDWRFAKHIDMYAGVMWSQVQNGLANGFALANGLPGATGNKASAFDPGVGLRYQF